MLAKQNNPNLILMDIRMPVMNGYEALAKIRADEQLKNIPKEDEEKAMQSGFDAGLFNSLQFLYSKLTK